ncbi:zincin-like metallopeptidase domain-containing protein [Caulobacter zeae]|uniref:zincin-like metallopeptidase domain-containing protein n=1 Tax=Caulobacter zeae TaxID=2055137 RepID=UPI001F0CB978|nr:zincin-like metallopeptidase domain-containing protein [Caulobacter zeae]
MKEAPHALVPTVRHADYLGAWLEILREDNRAVFKAASAASKAADFLLAFGADEAGAARGKGEGASSSGRPPCLRR